jgi:H+-translocating NAD(P) transhydrogenase subunit alpha
MKLAILKELRPDETRVAASPETVKKFVDLGLTVVVEKGAGALAAISDQGFKDAGATIAANAGAALKGADVVLKVSRPMIAGEKKDELNAFSKGQTLVCHMNALSEPNFVAAMAKAGVNGFAMELMPRITRAQSMDILSSQSNLAGYKAVLDAAGHYGRAFPMMMTAAGTVPPARAFIMGVGVAGLQAIATAKRLGAIVTATDVRPATKEQVESLGGTFIAVEDEEFEQAQTAGGYAKEMSAAYKKKQATLIADHIAKQDIVICTALIPGRPAPQLISETMVKSMKPGSVVVDLAVEAGGNCAGAKFGQVVEKNGVTIVGYANVPGRVAEEASKLFSRNLFNFLSPYFDKEAKSFAFDPEDEIIQGTMITKGGGVIHPSLKKKPATQKKAPAKKATAKKAPSKAAASKKAGSKPAKRKTPKKKGA